MARLAIKGHSTRGSEVIALLEMMGGKNNDCSGKNIYAVYAIPENGYIYPYQHAHHKYPEDFIIFTLEEFLEKFPYKVGDKVIYIKYNDGNPSVYTIQMMRWTGITIEYLLDSSGFSALTKDLQPYKEETMEDKPNLLQQLKDYFDNTPREVVEKEWHEYDKYNEIGPKVNEYLEYVNNIRQPKYPKTYEECCNILKIPNDERYIDVDVPLDYNKSLSAFTKLLICRDAYWKIADEQIGLGKSWEPDWENKERTKYCVTTINRQIKTITTDVFNYFLAFPTAEMRDAFYENFKELIEACKELL